MSSFRVLPGTARAIHAVLPFALIGAGMFASDPVAWLSSFCFLFVALSLGFLTIAGTVDLFCAAATAVGCCRRLQQDKSGPKPRVSEAFESLRAAWVFAALAAWPRYRMLAGHPTAIVFSLADAQPEAPASVALYALKLIGITLLVDGYSYVKHRLLHTPLMWSFHAGHHAFHNPSPFASFAVAPVEAFLTFWPVVLLCLPAAPVWAHAYALWIAGFVSLNMYLHAGYEAWALEVVLRAVGLNSGGFHNIHHERTVQNFGELCYIWDAILGTGAHSSAKKA